MGNTKSIIEVVRKEINQEDPIRLISTGAPNDEYDPEVKEIVKKISKAGSVEKLQNLVYKTFVEFFGAEIAGPRYKYKKLASNIFNRIKV